MPARSLFQFNLDANPLRISPSAGEHIAEVPSGRATSIDDSSEFLAWGSASTADAAAMAPAVQMLQNDLNCDAARIQPPGDFDSLAEAWRTLPAAIAILLGNPTADGWFVARRSSLTGTLPTSKDSDSIWEWLCETALQSRLAAIAGAALADVRDSRRESDSPLQPLVPNGPAETPEWLHSRLGTTVRTLASGRHDSPDWTALEAGLLLWHDRLDESHSRSQSIEGEGRHRNGDYWHALMHRREPDYGNSKYWFHHVGRHPAFHPLARAAASLFDASPSPAAASWKGRVLRGGEWNPSAFVDLCAECAGSRDRELKTTARRLQRTEMLLLLAQTCSDCGIGPAAPTSNAFHECGQRR